MQAQANAHCVCLYVCMRILTPLIPKTLTVSGCGLFSHAITLCAMNVRKVQRMNEFSVGGERSLHVRIAWMCMCLQIPDNWRRLYRCSGSVCPAH